MDFSFSVICQCTLNKLIIIAEIQHSQLLSSDKTIAYIQCKNGLQREKV